MLNNEVDKEVLLDGAQMNIAAIISGIAGFLKEKGIPFNEFVEYMGDAFEGSLEAFEGSEVKDVMEHLLTLEILPLGARVLSSKSSTSEAEVILTALPPKEVLEKFGTTPDEILEGFGVSREEFESCFAMYEPSAKAIGLRFEHQLQGDHEVIILKKS